MTVEELLQQIRLADAVCKGGRHIIDEEIETVAAFRELTRDDCCSGMNRKNGTIAEDRSMEGNGRRRHHSSGSVGERRI